MPNMLDPDDFNHVWECLDRVADMLETGNKVAEGMLASFIEHTGMPIPEVPKMQISSNLRMWANWLREHPEVDAAMYQLSSMTLRESPD